MELENISSHAVRKFDFVFVEHGPEGIEVDAGDHTGVAGIQVGKPLEDYYAITDFETLHRKSPTSLGREPYWSAFLQIFWTWFF